MDARPLMNCGQLPPVAAWMCVALKALPIRLHESSRAIVEDLHDDLPFMLESRVTHYAIQSFALLEKRPLFERLIGVDAPR